MQLTPNVRNLLVLTASILALSACTFLESFVPPEGAKTDVLDRQQGLTVDDFRDMNKADKLLKDEDASVKPTAALGAPPLPDLAQVLAAPRPPKVANAKLVTLAVTEDVPLRDVLFELGRLASVDIEVGSGLDKTGINLRATDRPFNEVIERIADLGGLRYSVNGNSIRVEKDTPYVKNYSLDFLNLVRSSSSSYTLSTSILSSSGGGSSSSSSSSGSSGSSSSSGGDTGGGVGSAGSSSSIEGKADSDLWTALEASVKEILNTVGKNGNAIGATGTTDSSSSSQDSGSQGGAAATSNSGTDNSSGAASATVGGGAITINRQAGILSVSATDRQHEMIQRFLTLMSRNASAQVLIEAKIVEVQLIDQFLSGINWNSILGDSQRHYVALGNYTPAGIPSGIALTTNSFAAGIDHGQLDAVIKATQRFGTTRTLSSPRLSAINNQQAVLTFARNEVFYDCTVTPAVQSNNSGSITTTPGTANCTAKAVPIGVILNILPSINSDSQEVTLSVRPTLTRKVGDAENPQFDILNALNAGISGSTPISSTVKQTTPIIEVRELDSIMKVKSGGIMIIGGLMEDQSRNQFDGIPGANEIPIFGNLFKSRTEDSSKRELVILIKATIVNATGNATPVDRAIIDKFTTDPRPAFPKNQ